MNHTIAAALQVVGQDTSAPCLDGSLRRYVNLDNAATTPPLTQVTDTVTRFADWYSSVHRGNGFKSQLSTTLFDEARRIVGDFVGVDWDEQTVIFCQHTTEAVNRVASRLIFEPSDIIISTVAEHHANLLPWSNVSQVVHVGLDNDGRGPGLDLEELEHLFGHYAGRVRLLAVTGASNITGYMPPIHDLAELAHANGALIMVDAAQLLPHRPVDVRPADDSGHLDFLAFSGHKMYAPYGAGALVARRKDLEKGTPWMLGGGAVDSVRTDEVVWTGLPQREEAGTPNLMGVLALAKACEVLSGVGMDQVAEHERGLTRYTLERLRAIPGLHLAGDGDPESSRDRVAVFSFNLDGYEHGHLAAILGYEYGIAVRSGCFCAHPYLKGLVGIDAEAEAAVWEKAQRGMKGGMPGLVRASLGCYSTTEDVDALVEALEQIIADGPQVDYHEDEHSGYYMPDGYRHEFDGYFTL